MNHALAAQTKSLEGELDDAHDAHKKATRKLDDVRSRMSDIVAQRVANRAETMQARAKKKVEREVSARVAGSADEMQRLRNENEQLRRQLELAHAVEGALRTSADEKSREIEKLERASQQREARYDPRNMQRVEV